MDLFYSDLSLEDPLLSSRADILPKLGTGVVSDSNFLLELDYAPKVPLYKLPPIPRKFTVLFEFMLFKFLKVFLE